PQSARPAAVGVEDGGPGNAVEVEMAQKDALMVCNPDFKRPFASVEDAVLRSEERLMIEQALMQEEKQALLEIRAEMESREKADREATEAKMRMAISQAECARAEAQVDAEMYARASTRARTATSLGDKGSGHEMVQERGGNMGGEVLKERLKSHQRIFLNDENETENVNTRAQGQWREAGELDLNSRRHPEGPVPCVPELDRERAGDALPVVDEVAGALAPEQLGVDRGGAGEAFRPQEHVGDGTAAQVLHLHLEHRVVADLPPRVGLLHLNARQIAPLARHCQRSHPTPRGHHHQPMGPHKSSSTSRREEGHVPVARRWRRSAAERSLRKAAIGIASLQLGGEPSTGQYIETGPFPSTVDRLLVLSTERR
ncbi:hypothetical protein B296_00035535, partial [Ensete ventricosum]